MNVTTLRSHLLRTTILLLMLLVEGVGNKAWADTYHYIVLNANGNEEFKCKNTAYGLPTDLQSPLVASFSYWNDKTGRDVSNQVNSVGDMADGGTYYVTYTLNATGSAIFSNTGNVLLKWGNTYLQYRTRNGWLRAHASLMCKETPIDTWLHDWTISGTPYAMRMTLVNSGSKFLASKADGSDYSVLTATDATYTINDFVVVGSTATGPYALMLNDHDTEYAASGNRLLVDRRGATELADSYNTFGALSKWDASVSTVVNGKPFRIISSYVNYHIVNETAPTTDAVVIEVAELAKGSEIATNFNTNYRAKVTRMGTTLGTTFYDSSQNIITHKATDGEEDIYVRYTFSAAQKKALEDDYNIYFSDSYETATWMNLQNYGSTTTEWLTSVDNSSNGNIDKTTETSTNLTNFAFIGDPYHFSVINQYRAEKNWNRYANMSTDSKNGGYAVYWQAGATQQWSLSAPVTAVDGRFQIQYSNSQLLSTPFYWRKNDVDRLIAKQEYLATNDFIAQKAAQAVKVRYVLVNNSGEKVIWYNVTTNTVASLSVPGYIKSPLAENYRIYATYADAVEDDNTKVITTVAQAAEVMDDGEGAVYVRYDIASNTVMNGGLFTIKLNNKNLSKYILSDFVIRDGTDQTMSPYSGYWFFEGIDPYGFDLRNYAFPSKYLGKGEDGESRISLMNSRESHFAIVRKNDTNNWCIIAVPSSDYYTADATYDNTVKFSYFNGASNTATISDKLFTALTGTGEDIVPTAVGVLYQIIDNNRELSVSAITSDSGTPNIPEVIKSPLAYDFTYYSDRSCETAMSTIPSTNCVIYVRYKQKVNAAIDLSGSTCYNIANDSRSAYLYSIGANTFRDNQSTTASDKTSNAYLWSFENDDPYNITVRSIYNNTYTWRGRRDESNHWLASAAGNWMNGDWSWQKFAIMSSATGKYEFMYAARFLNTDQYYAAYRTSNQYGIQNGTGNQSGNDNTRFLIENPFEIQVTYHIMSGTTELAKATVKQSSNKTPNVPQVLQSMLADYTHFYKDVACSSEFGSFETIGSETNIYVKAALAPGSPLDLKGTEGLTAIVSGQYMFSSSDRWKLTAAGQHPYMVKLQRVSDNQYLAVDGTVTSRTDAATLSVTTNGTGSTFFLREGGDDSYELVLVTTELDCFTDRYYTLGLDGSGNIKLISSETKPCGNADLQTLLVKNEVTYHVINLSGREALRYTPATLPDSYDSGFTDQFRSPLAKNYKYYKRNQFTSSTVDGHAVYTIKSGEASRDFATLGILSTVQPGDVFVTYEYDAAGATAMDFDISGTKSYTLHNKKTGHIFEMCVDNAGNLRSRNVITQKRMWYEWWPNGTKINNDTFDPYEVTLEVHCVDDQTVLTQLGAYTQATDKTAENANLKKYQSNRTCITWMILNKDASGSVALMVNRYPSVSNGSSASKFQYLCENEANSDNALQTKWYTGSEEDARFVFQPIYTYHVVNLSNTEAISAIEGHLLTDENHTPTVPQRILSPMVKKYQFYDKSCVTINGTSITLKANAEELSDVRLATDHDIYVFYRPADIDNSIFDLTGQVSYNMYTENQTLYAYDGSSDDVKSKASPTADEKESNSYLWILKGNDPYNVQIYNTNGTRNGQPIGHYQVSASDLGQPKSNWNNLPYFDLSKGKGSSSLGSINSYCMVWGTSATRGSSQIQLLAKSLSDINDWYLSNIQSNGFKFCWYFNTLGGSTGKNENSSVVNFIPAHNEELTYVIVNKKGNEALSVKASVAMGVAPNLPLALKSPFATNYTYHSTKSNSSDNIVTTTTENQTIYVYYDREETNTDLSLNAEGYYYMKVNGIYAYTDSDDNTGKTNNEKGTGDVVPYYVWTLDADGDPYDMLVRLPALDDKVLGLEGYTRPAETRRRVPAENAYLLKAVDATSDAAMRFALLNGNKFDGHYALAVTLGSAGSNGGTLPESALYGDMLDYVGSQSTGTLQLLQQSIDNVDDAAQVEFEPYTLYYTYHIVDPQADGNGEHPIIESYTLTDEVPAGTPAADTFPDALVRLGCPLTSNGYYTDAGTWPGDHDMRLGFLTDIYVSYEVDESLLPFRYSNSVNSIDQMYWHNWYGNGDTNAKIISSGDVVAGSQVEDPSESACFAFFGDPYRTQIINRQQGKTPLVTIGDKDTWSLISFSRDGDVVTPTTATTTDGWTWFRVFGTSNEAQPNYISAANPVALSNDKTSANWEEPLRHRFKAWGATYKVVDLADEVAATAHSRSAFFAVPEEILSPALDNSKVKYSFTNDRATAKSLVDITREPYSFETIYVFYTKDDVKDVFYGNNKLLRLDDSKKYNILVATNYRLNVNSSNVVATSQVKIQRDDPYLWTIDALYDSKTVDPYQLRLKNKTNETTTQVGKFILMRSPEDGHFRLMESSTETDGTTNHPYKWYTSAGGTTAGDTPAEVKFEGIPTTIYYAVVSNETQKIAIIGDFWQEGGDKPELPSLLRSPLAYNYTYYNGDMVTSNDKDKTFNIETMTKADELPYETSTIYVSYEFNNANSLLDLSGVVKYQISWNDYYMKRNSDNKVGSHKDPSNTDLSDNNYLWILQGQDPYNATVHNLGSSNIKGTHLEYSNEFGTGTPRTNADVWVGSTYEGTYVILNGSEQKENGYALVAAFNHSTAYAKYWNRRMTVSQWPNEGYAILAYQEGTKYRNINTAPTKNVWTSGGSYKENSWIFIYGGRTASDSISVPFQTLVFTPNLTLPVTYHLTHTVTGKKEQKDDDAVVLSRLTLPQNWERKYCIYTYTYYYKDGKDAEDNDVRMPITKEEYDNSDPTMHKVDNATVLPSLYIAEGDEETRVHIYVNYEANMPFNVVADTQAQIEALASTEILKTFFDMSSYEKRIQTLGSVVAEGGASILSYAAQFPEVMTEERGALRRCDLAYFMVMDTNDDYSKGNQYFLRHDDSNVDWLNNDYKLNVQQRKNYKQWSYSRLAEAYRENDHDPFQEKRWLWAFAGDPYDFFIFNLSGVMEETWDELNSNVETKYHLDHLVNYSTKLDKQGEVQGYSPHVPAYSDVLNWSDHYAWGLADGKGTGSDDTFSLMAAYTNSSGEFVPSITGNPLFWRMGGGKSVNLQERADGFNNLDYNIKVLPYVPQKYEDVRLLIRRDDEVATYTTTYSTPLAGQSDPTTKEAQQNYLNNMTTGIARMYFSTEDRMFVAGDVIDADDPESIPFEVRRAFCNYTFYNDDFRTPDGDYTIVVGPSRGAQKTYTINNVEHPLYDESGRPVYTYLDGDTEVSPQTVYASYVVTSDIFLKKRPTKAEVAQMKSNNDHVYFMDFPNPKMLNGQLEGYNTGHHAYFDETATFQPQVGTLYDVTEKMKWDSQTQKFVDDTEKIYNNCQYRTTANRMESVPEDLKWYFVGDPYHVQVYNTNSEFENDNNDCTNAANLARFDPTESRFQFVVDCVHLRVPDTSIYDHRKTVTFTDENGVELGTIDNNNYGKPYYNNFYWEMVPSATDVEDGFALRFRADNQILGYRNVYYYLAHDGLKREYRKADENRRGYYNINLNYRTNNARHLSGKYIGYHEANNDSTVIRLIQPSKVYFSAYKDNYSGNPVVKEELSEYFGVGETIYEVPRHLQRKFVEYGNLEYQKNNLSTWNSGSFPFVLDKSKDVAAYNMEDCTEHNSVVFVDGTQHRASYKFRVTYTVSDLTNTEDGKQVHLFTTDPSSPQWIDMMVGNGNWLYYDKTNVGGSPAVENQTTLVSNYRRAMSNGKTGWNNEANGWNDGLKGLHWAFIGDPYDFTILNRRRSEDGTADTDPMWLAVTKATILDADSVIWTTSLIDQSTYDAATAKTSTGTDALAEGGINTHFSLQMTKTGNNLSQMGNSDSNYFLRTASLKTEDTGESDGFGAYVGDYSNDQTGPGIINQTNNYWRLVSKAYPNGTSNYTSYFEMVPYSLNDFDTYSNNVNAVNYSQTMADMGVKQQLLTIRTAVAKDNDGADNDCFDADVQIVTDQSPSVLRIKRENLELRYGKATESLPISLKRYGCTYKCYLDYVDNDNRGIEITDFDSNEEIKDGKTFRELEKESSTNLLLTYVYTVQDNVSPFFTTELDAETEDYTWLNTYYQWTQYYKGTNVEVEYYEPVFDHYVYNADGHIIDEVYRYEKKTKIVSNDPTPYYPTAYVNTHTDQKPTYADEGAQSENDRQKWSLIGDPYSFNMKNYAQFLKNRGATVIVEGKNVTTSIIEEEAQNFTLAIDKNGNTYLSLVDENGEVIKCVSFDYSSTSDKNLTTMGTGTALYDPTGNTLDTGGAKPFFLANLIKYADILQYHLIIAHQHSLDAEEDYLQTLSSDDLPSGVTGNDPVVSGFNNVTKAEARQIVKNHLLEYLMYQGIYRQHNKDYYISTYGTENVPGLLTPTAWETSKETDIKTLLKTASLRDIVSYPVADYNVSRVGIGNRPAVPWYMRRQFCTYRLYQRDVQRSVTDTEHPAFQVADETWTGLTCTIVEGNTYSYYGGTITINDDYYAGQTYKSNDGTNPIPTTFIENDVTKQAYGIKWVSIFDKKQWADWDDTAKETDVKETVNGVDKKQPSGYDRALALQGTILEKLEDCHYNRKVIIDVVYEVNPEQFRFADKGRNTTAWYQMMTNNKQDGLLNFTYKDGIGARLDHTEHYTNNYLWAPEGDPYGFVLRSRYATINGTGWDDVAMTTKGELPKGKNKTNNDLLDNNGNTFMESNNVPGEVPMYQATYTSKANTAVGTSFNRKKVIHSLKGNDVVTDGATNAIYEMFTGDYPSSFLMHPTSAWTDNDDTEFVSYYMVHNTTGNTTSLTSASARTLRGNPDANWRLFTSAEQLWPYFDRAGYVGGLDPAKANTFANKELYNRLGEYVNDQTLPREYRVLNQARELVYSGTFKDNTGTEVAEGDARPEPSLLPMTFESTNLVNMKPGYYRIRAFSQKALDIDGNDLVGDGTNVKGIVGPRYISGYRFESEKTDALDPNNNGGRWLHFFETDQEHSTLHTFGQLRNKIAAARTNRALTNHQAMRGNIEILPAEYDPSSIFQFVDATPNTEKYTRYSIHTQGLKLWARAGGTEGVDATFGKTELSDDADFSSTNTGFDDRFRLDDVGGTAFTLRTITNRSGDWDNDVAENIKTNYICIDRNHRYRITSHTNNEMVEIGDHIEQGDVLGRSYAIQDTKWLLQPVGTKTAWPYNQMPLRVEVQKGGKNASNAEDKNYYGSLYVPFDTRLGSTVDVAFTMTTPPKGDASSGMSVTMQAVSQLNNMGNPQYIPATWPVVIRTNNQKEAMLKNQDGSTYATKHYVDLYLPYDEAKSVDKSKILLKGEYLEKTLSESSDLVQEPDNTENRVMVFGLPFANPHGTHEYDYTKRVGWYTNENWARENFPNADARSATDDQRDNRYVYHNKAYYIYNYTYSGSGAKPYIVTIFDDEDYDFEEDKDIEDTITERTPWPCDVYDLSGRKVASHETPQTLRQNNPGLPKGVYIFGHKKVVVK